MPQGERNTMYNKENSWFLPLFGELTVTNIAHFSGLAVLTVYLANTLNLVAGEIAFVMVMASVGLRFSRIALAPFIDSISPRRVIPTAIALSFVGYIGMAYTQSATAAGLCMLLIGTGYGINGMLVTTLVSYTAQQSRNAFPMYALMNTGTNLAASVAPIVANWLRLEVSPEAPFLFAAAIMCASFCLSMFIRSDIPSNYRDVRFFKAAIPLLRRPDFMLMLGMVVIGWMVYTQKFSATTLFVNSVLQLPDYVGLILTVNAVIVLLISLPLGSYIRFHGFDGHKVLALSFVLYALAYALLAAWTTFYGLWVSLALWSVAEALLMPQLNALVAEYTHVRDRLAGFSLSAGAIGLGEASGNALGASSMHSAIVTGNAWSVYAALAVISAVACAAAFRLKPSASIRESIA